MFAVDLSDISPPGQMVVEKEQSQTRKLARNLEQPPVVRPKSSTGLCRTRRTSELRCSRQRLATHTPTRDVYVLVQKYPLSAERQLNYQECSFLACFHKNPYRILPWSERERCFQYS